MFFGVVLILKGNKCYNILIKNLVAKRCRVFYFLKGGRKMLLSGAKILIEELIKHNVKTVFGYPGGQVLNIYDELYKNSHRIEHIISAHEQGAAHAADGYARATGNVGVVIATSGPGATNLVTGIANAYLDSIPLVAITGNVGVSLLGKDSFQEVDIVGITQPIVKHNFIVRDVKELEGVIKQAFIIATSDRNGPVLIDIPKDVQQGQCEYNENSNQELNIENNLKSKTSIKIKHNPCSFESHENNYEEAAKVIKLSKKPYIYCGGGVICSCAENLVIELSKKLNAPIGLSMMGLSAIPSSYELNLGMSGMHGKYASSMAKFEADLVIAVGARFSDRATGNTSEYAKNRTIIHIDIDDAEINKNVRSKIGLCGDIKEVLSQLINAIDKNNENSENRENKQWLEQINNYKQAEIAMRGSETTFSPQNIIELVNSYCNDETIVATDVGQHQMWTMQYYKFEKPRTLLTSGGLGTMGFGLGAAIGGCVGKGNKKTILFTSDGSFGMNLTELATAVSQKLPVVVVIINNGTLGMVRQWQTIFFDKRHSQSTLERKTDFPLLAKAFGAKGFGCNNLEQLKYVLENEIENDCPVVIDCKIDMDEMVYPMIPPGGSVKDIITAKMKEECAGEEGGVIR